MKRPLRKNYPIVDSSYTRALEDYIDALEDALVDKDERLLKAGFELENYWKEEAMHFGDEWRK